MQMEHGQQRLTPLEDRTMSNYSGLSRDFEFLAWIDGTVIAILVVYITQYCIEPTEVNSICASLHS
jgi:hypothetical protein